MVCVHSGVAQLALSENTRPHFALEQEHYIFARTLDAHTNMCGGQMPPRTLQTPSRDAPKHALHDHRAVPYTMHTRPRGFVSDSWLSSSACTRPLLMNRTTRSCFFVFVAAPAEAKCTKQKQRILRRYLAEGVHPNVREEASEPCYQPLQRDVYSLGQEVSGACCALAVVAFLFQHFGCSHGHSLLRRASLQLWLLLPLPLLLSAAHFHGIGRAGRTATVIERGGSLSRPCPASRQHDGG